MNRHRPHVLLICMLCAWAYLAEPSLSATIGVPSNFLGADTIGVVRLEVEQIDAPGLRDWALKALRDAKVDPQVVEEFAEQVRGMVAKSENWRQNLKRAGVTKVYLVVRQPILSQASICRCAS